MGNNPKSKIIAFSIFLLVTAIVWTNDSSLVLSATATEKNTGSDTILSQCYSNYCIYLPIVIFTSPPVPEINIPPCRWSFNPGQLLYITYKWGDRLQSPGSMWRNAFEAGLNSWNNTATPVWYYFDSSSDNTVNTYEDESNNRGITYITCIVNGPTLKVEMLGNIYYDIRDNYTVEQRRGIATHELGHGLSIGSIPNDYPYPSLMYLLTPLDFFPVVL
jgi:hypothetical protein